MSLNLWFRDEVQAHLVGVAVASLSAVLAAGAVDVVYCSGVLDNTRAVALTFGLRWADVRGAIRGALLESRLELLDLGILEGGRG